MVLLFGIDSIAGTKQKTPESFEVDPFLSRASVKVKYTLGSYEIPNQDVRGQLELHPSKGLSRVHVAFGNQGFRSGNPALDCHLQESLGLDYKESDFPEKHVCEKDRLPVKGKNSVRYPEVTFRSMDGALTFSKVSEKPLELNVAGDWSIHGIERPVTLRIQIEKYQEGYRVRGKGTLSLKDFGVEVKKFLFISVNDEVQAEWDLVFRPENP
jgi:polyisoprenoid-binding protein YceI